MPHPSLDRPEQIPAAFAEAWNRRDADGIATLFEEDAEFVNVVGLWWHDREAIRKAHAYGLERIFPDSTLEVVRVKVTPLAEGVAVVHARMRLTGQTAVGETSAPRPRQNVFTFVARQGPEGWRCVAAHNTDVVPRAETNVVGEDGRLRATSYREGPSPP